MSQLALTARVALQQIHAALSDDGFLEAYYRLYASIDSPKRNPWTRERQVSGCDLHKSCRLMYVAKSAASLWYLHNTTGEASPLQQCPSWDPVSFSARLLP